MTRKYFIGYSTTDATSARDVRFYNIDIVKRDIRNHFYTRKGERPMDPVYGFIGWDMLFETHIRVNLDAIIDDAKRIIKAEPRVKLVDLKVNEYEYGITINAVLDFEPDNVRGDLYMEFKRQNNLSSGEDETNG